MAVIQATYGQPGVYNATPPTLTDGQAGAFQFDVHGNVKTTTSTVTAASNASSTAYEASHVIKASSGTLYRLTGYNSKASAQFIQLHDAASLPADTAVPVLIFSVPATSNFSLDFGDSGMNFTTGIVVCDSSTGPTKTIGAADCFFSAQYV